MEFRESFRRGGGRIVRVRGVQDIRRAKPEVSTKQGSQGFAETKAAITKPALWVCARSSALHSVVGLFVGSLMVGKGVSLTLLPTLGSLVPFS